jgi:hypothetical protein
VKGIKTETLRQLVCVVVIGIGSGLYGARLVEFWGMFAVMLAPHAVFYAWDNRGRFRTSTKSQTKKSP